MAQAKLLPLLVGISTILFGLILLFDIKKNKISVLEVTINDKKGMLIILLITLLYLVSIIYLGFLFPTVAYLLVIIFFLNRSKMSMLKMLGIAAIYTVITMYIVPLVINIRLP